MLPPEDLGWSVYVDRRLVDFGSRRQGSSSLSSCEAEYYAASVTAAEMLHAGEVISELGGESSVGSHHREDQQAHQLSRFTQVCLNLYSDSSAARALMLRFGVQRTRHLTSRCLWLQTLASNRILTVRKVRTEDNVADVFTKVVGRAVRERLFGFLFRVM